MKTYPLYVVCEAATKNAIQFLCVVVLLMALERFREDADIFAELSLPQDGRWKCDPSLRRAAQYALFGALCLH